ncbi:uncharacterized protein At3g43530-like [Eutrema salsugineum]|uniref:uncharacterized protein At3g43530-like n=1 Tax=Eutrema salsugineum TaxID=72664 RepID=UPI000CED3F54|nr:uncharacterized protein At3g43530-like [Eutrema salsugineum]
MSTRGSPSQPERSEAEYATASEEGLGSNSNVDPLQPQEDVSIPMEPRGLFFKQSEYRLYPKLQSRCETFNFMEVFKRLDISERNWFENHPQFKHIVHVFIQKNRMLKGMWMLLLRTAVTDKQRQCWFVVNGVPVRYSIREHGLLSGLFCHHYPADYEQLGSMYFVEEQFGKTNIEVKEVREKLESMDFIEGCTDRLKMVDIISILVPEDGEAKLLLDILDEHVWDDFEVGEDDAVSDPVVDSWHTILVQQKKKIHLKDLYLLDVKSREDQPLPKPTDTEAVGSEDVLKKMEEGFIKINEKMEEGFRKITEKVHEIDTRLKSVEMKIADQRRDSDFMDFQYEDVGRVYETGGGSNARGDKGMEKTPAEETRDAPAPAPVPAEETRDAPAPVPAEETTDVPAPAVETTNAPTPVPAETPEPPAKKPRYKICMRKSAEAKRTAELIRNRRKGKPSRHISTPYKNDAPGERKKREAEKKK